VKQKDNRFYRTAEGLALEKLVETGRTVQITKEGEGYTVAIALVAGGWMSSNGQTISAAAAWLLEAWLDRDES
jgi:hypothetical protein